VVAVDRTPATSKDTGKITAVAGNTLGGVSLVAALAHAQFAERQPETA